MGPLILLQEIFKLMTPSTLFEVFWATLFGITVGMMPGLTATMGIALLTGLTFQWATGDAILILICMYVGAIYGGSRSAILINVPGTPAAAATVFDGYPLARSGRAGEAIGLATTASFLGSMIGLFFLSFFTPWLGSIALEFRSFEFFWLSLFGVIICGNLTAPKDPLKGWISGVLGLFLAMIGMDVIQAFPRYTGGSIELSGGLSLIPALVGLYGIPEVLNGLAEIQIQEKAMQIKRVIPRMKDLWDNRKNIVRSGIIGVIIGAIPGVGENIASYVSYDFAQRASKHPEKFGKGAEEGLIAAETANNACVGGAIIPVLALAVPGSPPAAVLMAAMWLHGMRPGPLLMVETPNYVYEVSAMFLIATFAMLILGLSMVRTMVKVLNVRNSILMPIVFILCAIGSFAIAGRTFDILIMLIFGVIGYGIRKMDYADAPFILGLILGDMLDENLRRSLMLTSGAVHPPFHPAHLYHPDRPHRTDDRRPECPLQGNDERDPGETVTKTLGFGRKKDRATKGEDHGRKSRRVFVSAEIQKIQEASLEILGEVGVKIPHPEIRRMLLEAGAKKRMNRPSLSHGVSRQGARQGPLPLSLCRSQRQANGNQTRSNAALLGRECHVLLPGRKKKGAQPGELCGILPGGEPAAEPPCYRGNQPWRLPSADAGFRGVPGHGRKYPEASAAGHFYPPGDRNHAGDGRRPAGRETLEG